jgi:import receptor subunit TOM22
MVKVEEVNDFEEGNDSVRPALLLSLPPLPFLLTLLPCLA